MRRLYICGKGRICWKDILNAYGSYLLLSLDNLSPFCLIHIQCRHVCHEYNWRDEEFDLCFNDPSDPRKFEESWDAMLLPKLYSVYCLLVLEWQGDLVCRVGLIQNREQQAER